LEGQQELNIFMMKILVSIFAITFFSFTVQAQTKLVKKDSIQLFYGLTAEKILSLSIPEAKALIKKKNISVSSYLGAKLEAENYLLKKKIKRDSIETMKIYDRIEKKLGMKKNDGKNKG